MLDKIIIVDYTQGSGGEYFSNFLTCHLIDKVLENDMQTSTDKHQKYFNSFSLIASDWESNFSFYLDKFLVLCQESDINSISIPLHLHKFPSISDQFQKISHTVRIVKINNDGYEYRTWMDFFKKIYLKSISKQDFNELKFRITNFTNKQKLEIVNKLKNNDLYWIDIDLIYDNKTANSKSRRYEIQQILNSKIIPPSHDIEINYEDFFVEFENITDKYYALCKDLAISPDLNLLNDLITRNRKNANELNQYIENFPTIINQL